MDTKQGFWSTLESLPGLCAVTVEWKILLGQDYRAAASFLRPDGRLATSYPCPLPEGCGCAHEVIQHSSDDIVAVCRCQPKQCEAITLSRRDIVLYEVNRQAISHAVASTLGAVSEHTAVAGVPMTWSIGTYTPYAGFRFSVYLTIQLETEGFRRVVDALVARTEKPFLLVAPTYSMFGAGCEELLQRRQAYFLALEDDFVLDPEGAISSRRPVQDILAPFLSTVRPIPTKDSSMAFFPTPPKATWADVEIRFKDGHTVSVKVLGERGVFNYTQMGMANKKNAAPTMQWGLLRAFADERGILTWISQYAHKKN